MSVAIPKHTFLHRWALAQELAMGEVLDLGLELELDQHIVFGMISHRSGREQHHRLGTNQYMHPTSHQDNPMEGMEQEPGLGLGLALVSAPALEHLGTAWHTNGGRPGKRHHHLSGTHHCKLDTSHQDNQKETEQAWALGLVKEHLDTAWHKNGGMPDK